VKHEDGEDFGPPPDTEAIAELLAERYPIGQGERVEVTARTEPTAGLQVVLHAGKNRYAIIVDYLRGAGERDPWMLTADALDALFGTFLESDRAYRDLPQGGDVEYEGAFFRVEVERAVPELAGEADRLLGEKH
jgi:hypothetical protein